MTVTQITTAMVERLKSDVTGVFYVEETDPQDQSLEDFILRVQLPSIAVGYQGGEYRQVEESGDLMELAGTVAVLVVIDDYRGYVSAMNEPDGIAVLLERIRESLQGQSLGLPMRALRPVREFPLAAVPGRVVWQQSWEVNFITA